MIQRLLLSFTSPRSHQTGANPWQPSLKAPQPTHPYHRCCRQDGFLFLDKAKFATSYAADVDPEKAAFWADSQIPWGVACLSGAIREPAWRTKPSWYLVATEDKRIPPNAQRAMAKRAGSMVVEAKGSHAIYFSQPKAVAALIQQASRKDEGAAVA